MKKSMIKKICMTICAFLLMLSAGCATAETIPVTSETVINESAENNSSGSSTTIADSNVLKNEMETIATESTEPTIPKIKFANEFNILKNENVEQVKVTKLTEIYDVLDEHGFVDLDPFLNTKRETVHIGTVDGIIVGQFEVDEDNIVWNFRNKNNIRTACNTCMKSQTSHFMSHNFHNKHASMRGCCRMNTINGICRNIYCTLETKGHICSV